MKELSPILRRNTSVQLPASVLLIVALACLGLSKTPSASAASVVFTTTPGLVVEAIDFASNGDLYYLETDYDAFTAPTQLMMRTQASDYTTVSPVFSYGALKFGSFVTASGGRIYFGESSDGTIRSVALNGSGPTLHATVPFHYDFGISPVTSDAFVTATTGFGVQNSEILQVDLGTGGTSVIVTNTNDYSGPLEFDSAGNLYYGGTGSPTATTPPTDVTSFTAAQIDSVAVPLNLSDGAIAAMTTGNSHFAFVAGEGLYRHLFGGLSLVDLSSGTSTPVPAPPPPNLGSIAHNGAALYGISTDFGTSTSTLYIIPESTGAILLLLASPLALRIRRKTPSPRR